MSFVTRMRALSARDRSGAEGAAAEAGTAEAGTAEADLTEGAAAEADLTEGAAAEAGSAEGGTAEDAPGGAAHGPSRRRRVAAGAVTTLACAFALFALIAPNRLDLLTPAALLRIPLEGLLGLVLVVVLPRRARRLVVAFLGLSLGLLTVVKVVDMGFYAVLGRRFDLVYGWSLLGDAEEFLRVSAGRAGAIGAEVGVLLLVLAVPALMTLALRRLSRIAVRHRTGALRAAAVLGVAWVACALLGAQIVPGVPVAANAYGRLDQVRTSLRDREVFARQVAADRFHGAPGSALLTGLRGKNVLLTFVESYGRSAIENRDMAPQVDAVLDAGTRRLRAAGFGARSAFLTSPTEGGGSWLAHSTLLSGLWIDSQQRYDSLIKTNRLTLTTAFRRAGWRTVAVVPGVTRTWPEAKFFGYQRFYDRWHLGYQGPRFNWGMPPDQYTLSAFQHLELDRLGHPPVMAEMPMVSSHAPWAPTPRLIDWKKVGDGSAFNGMPQTGNQPDDVWRNAWRDPTRVREAYRGSIVYSLSALVSYVQTYGDDDLVLIFLGDHQPAPLVTGQNVNHDVPITIVAKDPAVLDRISGWGWQDGLRPGRTAPVWRMSAFRDRFLTAFGSRAASAR